jgi:hypothetical protein
MLKGHLPRVVYHRVYSVYEDELLSLRNPLQDLKCQYAYLSASTHSVRPPETQRARKREGGRERERGGERARERASERERVCVCRPGRPLGTPFESSWMSERFNRVLKIG